MEFRTPLPGSWGFALFTEVVDWWIVGVGNPAPGKRLDKEGKEFVSQHYFKEDETC
jgi:hypothetical protein